MHMVYIETSIVSYLVDNLSWDLKLGSQLDKF